jgi:hypothetical protein
MEMLWDSGVRAGRHHASCGCRGVAGGRSIQWPQLIQYDIMHEGISSFSLGD